MKTQRIVAFLALALGLATTASAEVYGFKQSPASKTSLFADNNGCWTNAQGTAAGALSPSDVLHLLSSVNLTKDSEFGGVFHAGAEDGTGETVYINLKNYTLTLSDFRWHNASIRPYASKNLGIFSGAATLDNPTKTHSIGAVGGSGASAYGGTILEAALTCANSDMQVTIDTSSGPAYYTGLSGDNSGYQGRFKQNTALTPLFVGHANALGSPLDSRSDALLIDAANAVFSVVKGVTPNATRGIDINKDGFRICATNYTGFADRASDYRDCTEFELPMPITGEYGFTKTGPGTVTLSGEYTAGDIVVESGTLVITSTADFPEGQRISVASGAELDIYQSTNDFVIVSEDGAIVKNELDPIAVTYNAEDKEATAVEASASFRIPAGMKQPIALSSAIKLPLDSELQLEVLTVAAGAATLLADAFVDETTKTFGLPKTSFEVTTDGEGVQHVYLNVRPVVVSVGTFQEKVGLAGNATSWSNGTIAQSGYDYLVTNIIHEIGNADFAGDSLTIAGGQQIRTRHTPVRISPATVYPGSTIQQYKDNGNYVLTGNLNIVGQYGSLEYVTFLAYYKGGWHQLAANLSGEGTLRVQGGMATGAFSDDVPGNPQLYGDNSAYKGKIYMTATSERTEGTGAALTFNSANALGGALDTFKYDSLTLDRYSTLRPATSIDFSTENRGIYGSGPFGFDVAEGLTFKVGVPVKMDDVMFKHGEGDLFLGGEISFGGSSSKTCYVREGGIGALDDAAVAGLNVVFSNGTKIVVAPDATLVNGFTGVSFEPADATVVVGLASDFTPPANGASFTVAIATVRASAGDLSSRFTLERLRGYTGTITTENVVVDEVSCIRYSAKYVHSGMVINVL